MIPVQDFMPCLTFDSDFMWKLSLDMIPVQVLCLTYSIGSNFICEYILAKITGHYFFFFSLYLANLFKNSLNLIIFLCYTSHTFYTRYMNHMFEQ